MAHAIVLKLIESVCPTKGYLIVAHRSHVSLANIQQTIVSCTSNLFIYFFRYNYK